MHEKFMRDRPQTTTCLRSGGCVARMDNLPRASQRLAHPGAAGLLRRRSGRGMPHDRVRDREIGADKSMRLGALDAAIGSGR